MLGRLTAWSSWVRIVSGSSVQSYVIVDGVPTAFVELHKSSVLSRIGVMGGKTEET